MKLETILKPISTVLSWEGIRIYVTRITPQDASRLLDPELGRNQQNRAVNKTQVRRLAEAMTRGHWRLTHQGIAFDRDDVLIDGQHRLAAIATSGKAQVVLVCEGFDPLTRVDIDQMWVRKLRDSLLIMGVVARPEIAARVVTSIMHYGRSDGSKIDFETAKEQIEVYRVGIEWASRVAPVGSARGFSSAAVLGAFAYAYPHAPSVVEKAWRDLNSGAIGDEDDGVLRLRNQILVGDRGRSAMQSHTARREVFLKTLSALYHRVRGTTTKLLKPSDLGWRYFSEAYRQLTLPAIPISAPTGSR